MTKAEFIKRLEDEFRRMIADVERLALAEIEGHRARMDAQTFAGWILSEIEKVNTEPALKYFDMVLRPSYSKPEDAAQSIANELEGRYGTYFEGERPTVVRFDPTRANWPEIWERLKPYFEPQSRRIYHYVPRPFSEYKAAAKAEARAKIFATAANKGTADTGKPRQQPPKEEPPAFADLFVNAEAMEKALQAARAVGILNAANHWEYGGKVGAIVIFWEFLREQKKVVKPEHINNPLAIDSIAAFWEQTISDRTKRNAPRYRSELLRDLKAAFK